MVIAVEKIVIVRTNDGEEPKMLTFTASWT